MTEATEIPEAQAPAESPPETVLIDNVNTFVMCTIKWHEAQTGKIRHLLTVPDGTTFEIDSKELVLTGDALAGFKFGVELALLQVKDLPFVVEFEGSAAEATAEAVPGG